MHPLFADLQPLRAQPHVQCAGGRGAQHFGTGRCPALHHLGARMAEAVAVPGRHQCQPRPHRVHPRCAGRAGAAMVGHQRRVRLQRVAVGPQQLGFFGEADVTGEQDHPARGGDAQHTAGRIAALPVPLHRMQDFEIHPVPSPLLAAMAGRCAADSGPCRRPHRHLRKRTADPGQATGMVGVGMAEQHPVRHAGTQCAERGQHDALAGIGADARGPEVVQQQPRRGPHHHRSALPHVQHQHLHRPRRRQLPIRPEQRQA